MATPIPQNSARFTLSEIALATGGTLTGGSPETEVRGVCTDSRAIEKGALFVALVGETHDGHEHVGTALSQGASAVVVRRGTATQGPRIEVEDTLLALGRIARAFVDRERKRRPLPVIAITGSAGKTTTKEFTAAVVRAVFGETLATRGNLNNLVGVPMTLLTLTDAHKAMVIECGTNARGEIARLGAIVAPDVGVVVNADAGHTAGLGGIEDVAFEKAAMFRAARTFAIGNADDPPSRARLEDATVPTLTFGCDESADVRLVSRQAHTDGTTHIRIALPPRFLENGAQPTLDASLAIPGLAAAIDATAAIAGLAALRGRLTRDDLANAASALARVEPTPGRFAPVRVRDFLVVDDTYNANPRSMRASIATAREMAESMGGRLVLALGDMLELGLLSPGLHREVVETAVKAGASVLVTLGPQMMAAVGFVSSMDAPSSGDAIRVIATTDANDAAHALDRLVRAGDVVLVKGSRGMRMERLVEHLMHGDAPRKTP